MPLYFTETEAQKRKRLPRPAPRAEHDSIPVCFFLHRVPFSTQVQSCPKTEKITFEEGNAWGITNSSLPPGEHSFWKEKENRGGWGRTEESALFSGSIQLEIGLQIAVILNKYGSHRRGLKGGLWAHRLCWGSEKCYDENCLSTEYKPIYISSTREAMVGTPCVPDQPGLQCSILPQKHTKTNHNKKCTHQT